MNQQKITRWIAVTLLAATVSACQWNTNLKQVDSDAPEKPINTPEQAAELQQKYLK